MAHFDLPEVLFVTLNVLLPDSLSADLTLAIWSFSDDEKHLDASVLLTRQAQKHLQQLFYRADINVYHHNQQNRCDDDHASVSSTRRTF